MNGKVLLLAPLCHKEPARSKQNISKVPSRLWMPELVLYGIRLLAKQFLGTVLEIEVDQSGCQGGHTWGLHQCWRPQDLDRGNYQQQWERRILSIVNSLFSIIYNIYNYI